MIWLKRGISCRGCFKQLRRPLNCGHCGLLQRQTDIRASLNYFSLFSIPVSFKLD